MMKFKEFGRRVDILCARRTQDEYGTWWRVTYRYTMGDNLISDYEESIVPLIGGVKHSCYIAWIVLGGWSTR